MVRAAAISRHAAVGSVVWRSSAGAAYLTVVVRGSFSIERDGVMTLLPASPLQRAEVHHDGLVTRSVRYPSDTAPFKPACDVILIGCAYAPPGTTETTVRLSLSRGPRVILNKTLEISGEAFDRMPLTYERAYGGPGYAPNPLGVGVGDGATPNIRYPAGASGTSEAVAGFGAISELWPERRGRLGEHRASVRAPEPTIPADFDWRFFQAAPADQQTVYLVGDELIMLDGLRPARPHSEHTLPKARAVAAVFGLADERALVAMEADTLLIEPDEQRVSLTWRGVVEVPDPARLDGALITAGVAVEGAPIVLPSDRGALDAQAVPSDLNAPPSSREGFEGTVALQADVASDVAAPFAIAAAGKRSSAPPAPPWQGASDRAVPLPTPELAGTLVMSQDEEKALIDRVLEHRAAAAPPPAPEPAPEPKAVTADGVPLRWRRRTEEPPAPEPAPAAEAKPSPVPQLTRRAPVAPRLYDGLAGKGKHED